ncbi:SlyX family protein [Methyloterricola oryzae]|uniref:SlyX family protein n=1 Tax=Methyloterricola oryzae TaxID=1495050 RepID=UPI0005EB42E6|nr:SlyX family protein [Methyloterricola oryzae]
MDILTQRLVELESRLAYQDDLVVTLNDVVSRQQLQIDRLEATVRVLLDRVQRLSALAEGADPAAEERPPHY